MRNAAVCGVRLLLEKYHVRLCIFSMFLLSSLSSRSALSTYPAVAASRLPNSWPVLYIAASAGVLAELSLSTHPAGTSYR